MRKKLGQSNEENFFLVKFFVVGVVFVDFHVHVRTFNI
jgi:hypothetical protein